MQRARVNVERLRVVRGEGSAREDGRADLDALAVAARDGDEIGMNRLWTACRDMLTRLAVAFGIPPDDVAGVVQETMLAGHSHLDSFDPGRGSFRAWIGTILVRQARNRLRGERRRGRFLLRFRGLRAPGGDASVDPAAPLVARMTLQHLLGALTERQREVIALYEIGELDAKEVARALGISEAGVRSAARQARDKLARVARRLDRGTRGSGDRP